MNLKQRWRNIFQKKQPFKIEEGHVITPAFISGGVQYYQLHDIFNSFCARAMDALALYENWQMRCTITFLQAHTTAIDAILRDPKKINIMDIGDLNSKLKERLQWAIPTEELIYKFAAVAYFDESESPYKYDNSYGEQKIKRWKKENEIDGFFLARHIRDLIPSPDLSEADFKTLSTIVQKIDKKHFELISGHLSSSPQSKDLLIKLSSERSLTSTPLN